MENWQSAYITTNLDKLVKVTICNTELLVFLNAKHILGDADVDAIDTKTGRFDRAKLLYDIIRTKTGGYNVLVKALLECRQSGAVEILLDGIPQDAMFDIKVNFLGSNTSLSTILQKNEIVEIRTHLKNTLQLSDYFDVCMNNQSGPHCAPLVNDTIPSPIPIHIPRILLSKLQIDPAIFSKDCTDIFVFKTLNLDQLTDLASPYAADISSNHLHEPFVRFIVLQEYKDWEIICSVSQFPIHLISYDDAQSIYTVDETRGESKVLEQYLVTSHSSKTCHPSSEESLAATLQEADKGFIICGQQGSGKSVVLANIARMLAKLNTKNAVVSFIYLPHLITMLQSRRNVIGNKEDVRRQIVEYISPTTLTQAILIKMISRAINPTKIYVFADGYDDIQEINRRLINDFLIQANDTPNIKFISSARPPHGSQCNEFRDAINLLPFKEDDHINLLLEYWKQKYPKCQLLKLKDFAKECLNQAMNNLTEHETELFDRPLLSHLVADCNAKNASILSEARQHGNISFVLPNPNQSFLFYLFKQFIDTRLGSDSDTANILSGRDTSIPNVTNLKRYHIHEALQLIYPEIAIEYAALAKINETHAIEIIGLGILRKLPPNSVSFLHCSFALYLISEFLAHVMLPDFSSEAESMELSQKAMKAFCVKALNPIESGVHSIQVNFPGVQQPVFPLYTLDNPEFAYFINAQLQCRPAMATMHPKLIEIFYTNISAEKLYRILQCTLSYNQGCIFRLIKQILEAINRQSEIINTYRKYLVDANRAYNLFLVAVQHSSVALVKDYIHLCLENLKYDLNDICQRIPLNQLSPLHLALNKGNNEVVEYLLEHVYKNSQRLLQILVCFTRLDGFNVLQKKIQLMKDLIKRDRNIIQLIFPLLGNLVHKELIKFLFIECKTDILQDYYGNTIAHHVAKNISANDYHDLVCFFLQDHNAGAIFRQKNRHLLTPLHEACYSVPDLKIETVHLIAAIETLDIHAIDEDGNNILLSACAGNGTKALLEGLVDLGLSYHVRNNKDQNALHLAVEGANIDAVLFFKTFPFLVDEIDNEGRRPVDLARQKLEHYQIYPNVYGSIIERLNKIIPILT